MIGIRQLRKVCWEPIYAAGGTIEDGFDDRALHWIALDEQGIVAAARMTIHHDLEVLPDAHLFNDLRAKFHSFPIGYMSRLVVHPRARGRGLPAVFDKIRIDIARALGCKTMVGIWNPQSGEKRRFQLVQNRVQVHRRRNPTL